MSNLSKFLKTNKIKKENVKYPATKSLCDDNGEPLLWEIRPLTSKESNKITDECSYQEQVPGKPNQFVNKMKRLKKQKTNK